MISGANIGAVQFYQREYNLRTKKQKGIRMVQKFTPIGIVDDFVEPGENNGSKYSIGGKVRGISESQARQKIASIRKEQGSLISAKDNKMDMTKLDNVFINTSDT